LKGQAVGFGRDVEEKLRKRDYNVPEETKWRNIYRILFPETDEIYIPSPCRLPVSFEFR
jgi:hypothetical protein